MVRGRAAPTETLKNTEPASETVKKASAPVPSACVVERRAKGMAPKMRVNMRRRKSNGVSGPLGTHRQSSRDRRRTASYDESACAPERSTWWTRRVRATLDRAAPQRSPEMQLKEFATSEVGVRHETSSRRRLRYVALVSTFAALAAACGADARSASDNRAIAIYSPAVRAAVAHPIGNPPTTTRPGEIFVVGAHASIPLSVQAGIAEALESLGTIRFVDSSSEAIDNTTPDKAVHGNGVLITLGDIPTGRDDVTISVQRYERSNRNAALTLELRRTGSIWTVVRTTGS